MPIFQPSHHLFQCVHPACTWHRPKLLMTCLTPFHHSLGCAIHLITSASVVNIWFSQHHWYQYIHLPFLITRPLPSSRHHLSYDDCLEDKRENYQKCSVLCCVLFDSCAQWYAHTWAVLNDECSFRFRFSFCVFT